MSAPAPRPGLTKKDRPHAVDQLADEHPVVARKPATPPAVRRVREIRVPLSVRIRLDADEAIRDAAARRGLTIQAAVDEALASWLESESSRTSR